MNCVGGHFAMADQENYYSGREQSQIKHFLLERYLTDMSFKVALSQPDVLTAINYVDGFSGPWGTRDEADYSDTSFGQAIIVLKKVRSELQRLKHERLPVRFVFCEKNRTRHGNLVKAVSEERSLDIRCLHGRFEEKLKDISAICRNGFTFTFIDPTGFKLNTIEISKFLRKHRGEFLWNYMADHANRFLTREGLEDAYGTLLADTRWMERCRDPDLSNLNNEQKILTLLRERLKELGCATYVIDFPVLRPRKNRVQYRLLFGTRSASGVSVFRSAQKKAEQFQIRLREQIKQKETEFSLVSPDMHAISILASEGIDGSRSSQSAPKAIISFLVTSGPILFSHLVAPLLETERLTESGLKNVLVKMRQDGSISYSLPPKKRKPQGDTLITLGGKYPTA
jgi:three-Cys-motif partner protein